MGAHISEGFMIFDFTSQRIIGGQPDVHYLSCIDIKSAFIQPLQQAYIVTKFPVIKTSAC